MKFTSLFSFRYLLCRPILGLLVLAAFPSAYASAYQGLITQVTAINGGTHVLVTVANGSWDGQPAACGTSSDGRVLYIIDATAPAGRTMVALAVTAKLSGRLVWAGSAAGCSAGFEQLVTLDLKG